MSAPFRFDHVVLLPAPVEAVSAVLGDLQGYPQWWPQVRSVTQLDEERARVVCRSALPYSLNLVLRAVDRSPDQLVVDLSGDLVGRSSWTLTSDEDGTRASYEQQVTVTGPLAGAAGFGPARAVMRWNHDRMMAGCDAGLRRRLAG